MTLTSPTITNPTITVRDRTAVRSSTHDLRTIPDALRSEWIKVTALRMNAVILALTAIIGAVIAGGLAATNTNPALTASELFIYPLPLVAMLAGVTGILLFTGESQHGTLAITLIARPARWVTVAAKVVMSAAMGLALAVVGMGTGLAGAVAGGVAFGSGSHLVSRAAWAGLYIVVAALIGLGVGMIVRHSAGAISGLLMWSLVIESLFAPMIPESLRHALPFSAGYRLLDAGPDFEAPVQIPHLLDRPQYALIFGAYAVVSLTLGTVLLHRRDTN